MNIYTCNFEGHNPIGATAVVVARDRGHARRLLNRKLQEEGLELSGDEDIVKVETDSAQAIVLHNGDY